MARRRIIFSQQLWHLHSSLLLSCKYNSIAVSCCDKQHFYVLIICWWPNEGAWPFAMALCLWHDNIFYFICDIGIRSFNLFLFFSVGAAKSCYDSEIGWGMSTALFYDQYL